MGFIESANPIVGFVVGIIVLFMFLVGVVSLFRGGWKAIKNYTQVARKIGIFIDKMLPDILEHLGDTGRIPKNILSMWAKEVSEGLQSYSPSQITTKGYETMRVSGMDRIFEAHKDEWAEEVRSEIPQNASRLDIESSCINFIARLYKNNDTSLIELDEYMYEHPNEIPTADIYALLGISLREYMFKKYTDLARRREA